MPRWLLFSMICIHACGLFAQDLAGIAVHGFVTQGFLFSSNNNYLAMKSSEGSPQWTDGAVSVSDSIKDNFRVGIQLHMYQLGDLGGAHVEIDWASADYRLNDHFGIRGGKVKTPIGLFNDSQDVDAIFLWILLPQGAYPVDNKSFLLSHWGGEAYGDVSVGKRVGKMQYRGYAGENTLDLHGGYIKNLAESGLNFTTPPEGKIYGGDLRWQTPLAGLTAGFSGLLLGLNGTAVGGGGVHLPSFFGNANYAEYQRHKLYMAGEYRRQPTRASVTFGPFTIPAPKDERTWFAMASYRIWKRFQAGSYYSHYVNKGPEMSLPANYSKDWVLSGRYDFNAYFYGKIEGHFLHGTALGYYEDTNPTGLKTNSSMLAAKIGCSF